MFDVNMVTELEAAGQSGRDIRAQRGLSTNQLLQTLDGERVLSADIQRS